MSVAVIRPPRRLAAAFAPGGRSPRSASRDPPSGSIAKIGARAVMSLRRMPPRKSLSRLLLVVLDLLEIGIDDGVAAARGGAPVRAGSLGPAARARTRARAVDRLPDFHGHLCERSRRRLDALGVIRLQRLLRLRDGALHV